MPLRETATLCSAVPAPGLRRVSEAQPAKTPAGRCIVPRQISQAGWTIWFGAYLITYGLTVWLPTIYRTTFDLPLEQALQYVLITQLIGLAGTLTCALTIDHFGRRPWFATAFVGAAAALLALWLLGADSPVRVLALVSTAFFFSSVVSIGAYLYTPELYPTRSRAMGVGAATAWLQQEIDTLYRLLMKLGLPVIDIKETRVAA